MTYPDDVSQWHITMTYQWHSPWPPWHILMTCHDDMSQWHINDINRDRYDISWWQVTMTYSNDTCDDVYWRVLMTYAVCYLMTYHDDIWVAMTHEMTYTWWHIMMTHARILPVQMCFDDICDDISPYVIAYVIATHRSSWHVITWYVIVICHRAIFFTDEKRHGFCWSIFYFKKYKNFPRLA